MRKLLLLPLMLALSFGAAFAQASPYNLNVFKAQSFNGTGQTGATIQLNGLPLLPGGSTIGSSYASGTITVTGTALTTVSFQIMGSSDNGATFYLLPVYSVVNPAASPVTTVTATASGLYQINLAGLSHIKLVTTGTFTATSVSIVLTGSPNASISRNGNGGAVMTLSSPDNTIDLGGTGPAPTLDINLALANTWTQGMTIQDGLTLDTLAFTTAGEAMTFPNGSEIFEDPSQGLFLVGANNFNLVALSGENLLVTSTDGTNSGGIAQLQSASAADSVIEARNGHSMAYLINNSAGSTPSFLDSSNLRELQLGTSAITSGIPTAPFAPNFGIGDVTTTITNTKINLVGDVSITSLRVGKTFATIPQATRGIVGTYAGLSTSNVSPFMDIFPFGYNPLPVGIRFQDGATDTSGSAIELGVTADGVSSQHIRFYSQRTPTFDSVFDLFMKGGTLIWAGGLAIGQPGISGCLENAYSSRFCYDATNGNALVHAGGSVIATNLGIGFTSGVTPGATYWGLIDKSGNVGFGPQHDETISNVALLNPFSVAGPSQAVPGAAKAPSFTATGLPTGCAHLPCVLVQNIKPAQTIAVGATTLYTTPASGWYQICGETFVTTVGTAGTITESWASTISLSGGSEAHTLVGATSTTAVGGNTSCTGDVFAGSGSVISYNTTFTSVTGTPVYTVEASVKLAHL